MILEAVHTIKAVDTEENLNNQGFRWLRILSSPANSVTKLQTNQAGEISPYITINPLSDWLDLKQPCTVSRIKCSVLGDVTYQYSLDDRIHSNLEGVGGGGSAPGPFPNVPVAQVSFSGVHTITVPDGMATLRLGVGSIPAGHSVIALDITNVGIGSTSRLLFRNDQGVGYRTIDADRSQQTYILDVAGCTAIEIISTGGSVTIEGEFSTAPTLGPLKSIVYTAIDLGITEGTSTFGGTWDHSGLLPSGATSWSFHFLMTAVDVGGCQVGVLAGVDGLGTPTAGAGDILDLNINWTGPGPLVLTAERSSAGYTRYGLNGAAATVVNGPFQYPNGATTPAESLQIYTGLPEGVLPTIDHAEFTVNF